MSGQQSSEDKKNSSEHGGFSITLEQVEDFEFRVKFDGEDFPDLTMDEPHPIGGNKAPNASRFLAAAVGNCLSASLLFCLRKSRVAIRNIRTGVRVQTIRAEKGRLRIGKIDVTIDPGFGESEREQAQRCLQLFEDFCVVTQSVRDGIDVEVSVKQ
jgi:organic hydroperoxide reductase OsmC/OhrA